MITRSNFLSSRFSAFCRFVAYGLLLAMVVSCGKAGVPRYELSGTVTYQGKPVPAGSIRFEPVGTTLNNSTIGDADIKDGKYSTLLDRGIIGGRQRVFVYGFNGIPEPGSGPEGAAIFGSHIVEIDLPDEASKLDIQVPDSVRPLRPF